MKSTIKVKKLGIILGIFMALVIAIGSNSLVYYENNQPTNNPEKIKSAKQFWILTEQIEINEYFADRKWSYTAQTYDWCSGSGTLNDPYLIENVTISTGRNWFNPIDDQIAIWIVNDPTNPYFIIRNCTVTNSFFGILVAETEKGLIVNNTVSNHGAYMPISPWAPIGNGITLFNSNNNTVENNTVTNNVPLGICAGVATPPFPVLTDGNYNNTIVGNKVQNNNLGGIMLEKSDGNTIENNIVINNGDIGIGLRDYLSDGSDNNTIYNNTVSDNTIGIGLQESNENKIIENTAIDNDYTGIGLEYSTENTINDNTATNNGKAGIGLTLNSDNNTVYNNTVDTHEYGIALDASNDNEVIENTVANPLLGGIGLNYSDYNYINNNNITYSDTSGIGLEYSNYNNISENNAYHCIYGISLGYSFSNNVSNNDAYYNDVGIGANNSDNNLILNNDASQNLLGMGFMNSSDNTIFQNTLTDNTEGGLIFVNESDGNLIYNNEFINNPIHAQDNSTNNEWDNGSLGNYWEDYTGHDESPIDGIGDIPYDVPGTAGSQDHYPIWRALIRIIMPENKSYLGPMSGYYPATYGFENDEDSSFPEQWIKDGVGSSYEDQMYVVASKDGHNKVFYLNDTDISYLELSPYQNFDDNQTSGTIELWIYFSNQVDDAHIFIENYTGDVLIDIFSDNDAWRYNDGLTTQVTGLNSINEWFYLSIDFDSSLNEYNFSIYLANSSLYYQAFDLNYKEGEGEAARIRLSTADTMEGELWIDAVGYSWDNGYQIGDNQKEGLLLDIEDSIGLNWSAYSLDGQTNITIIGDRVILLPDYGSHSIQVFANDSNGVDYSSKIRYFRVNFTRIPILIDDDIPSIDWDTTTLNYEYCRGTGTQNDPYIIEYIVIDVGGNGNAITIRNSDVYFIIRNCIISNAGTGSAGILLQSVGNGTIINNDCSDNNDIGIKLIDSDNNDVFLNTLDNNLIGIDLANCENNNISGNYLTNNEYKGIILDRDCIFNNISGNFISYSDYGIEFSGSDLNEIIDNTLNNNEYGIYFSQEGTDDPSDNNVAVNEIFNNDYGIYISEGQNNNISENHIHDNDYGIYISNGEDSLIYLNNFTDNSIQHAWDDGTDNDWDNGVIGNHWDNYTGKDMNDDGIGDSPHEIPGSAGSQDNFPIWDDGPYIEVDGDDDDDKKKKEDMEGLITTLILAGVFAGIGIIALVIILIKKGVIKSSKVVRESTNPE